MIKGYFFLIDERKSVILLACGKQKVHTFSFSMWERESEHERGGNMPKKSVTSIL